MDNSVVGLGSALPCWTQSCLGIIEKLRGWGWLLLDCKGLQSVFILVLINLNEVLNTHRWCLWCSSTEQLVGQHNRSAGQGEGLWLLTGEKLQH